MRYAAFSRGGTFQGDYDEMVTVGDTSYLDYCDAHSLTDTETIPATPSATTVHHQRTIVSIVSPAVGENLPEFDHPALGLLAVIAAGSALLVPVGLRRRRAARV